MDSTTRDSVFTTRVVISEAKSKPSRTRPRFAVCLGAGVLLARALTSGPAYFADAGRHLTAIANHSYVIQPPGYWLFNRVGGLFPDPELGILVLNWCFSALGCVVFYACARRLVRQPLAELGALLYATVFFSWFSGNVHSTYASQLLFAPLTFYCILRFRESQQARWLFAIGASFAIGAGLRPSDGIFLAPLVFAFAMQLPRKQGTVLAVVITMLCVAWLVPNEVALHRHAARNTGEQLSGVAVGAIALGRLNLYTLSNALRFLLPLALALGPVGLFLIPVRNWLAERLWLWVLPGSLFFLLIYISDAPYLDCLLGGFILIGLLGLNSCRNQRLAVAALTLSIAINTCFYLGYRPIRSRSGAAAVINKDLGMYSYYAVRNRIMFRLQESLEKR